MLRLRRINAPVEASFSDWAAEQLGDESTAKCISNFMGVATFDYDPGRLSAAFVQERLRRATQFPSPVRYIEGSWGTLVQGLADHARSLGVRIETNSPVDRLPPAPVILAVQLSRAAELLGDESLDWSGTRTALLDVGMKKRRRDPFIISDLDSSGWAE
ncbi:MAG: FAD-dependent oxidoreductase, partial [Nitrososphaerales archaeon]